MTPSTPPGTVPLMMTQYGNYYRYDEVPPEEEHFGDEYIFPQRIGLRVVDARMFEAWLWMKMNGEQE